MSFSYLASGSFTNGDRVRFHIGDTDSTRAIFSDEEISALITEAGSWQKATIYAIQSIIARLSSNPDMTADWLHVSYATALASYEKLLTLKARELGVPSGTITATALYVYRPDSQQKAAPTYPDDAL